MEKQKMFTNELNCASEQLENCFFNPNWDNSVNTNDPFHSALSSMVSSPSPSNAVVGDAIVVRELIGTLGNSPPELKLSILDRQISPATFPVNGNRFSSSPFSADLGFAERAARLSCFAAENLVESVKIGNENAEVCDSMENSSVSEQIAANDANCRKRKAISKGKAKANPSTNSTNVSPENSESSAKKSKSDDRKSAVPPKDYIHVRARRGQATDAHSLAERVRREKISERMKLLQDLVPGCNKVTGKAVMLDEIINYVQSLQKQVEFLSMKLANVNPNVDFDVEALLFRDMFQSRGAIHHNPQPSDYSFQCQQGPNLHSVVPSRIDVTFPTNPFDDASGRIQSKQHLPLENFGEMISTFWEDDLHGFVQMGIGQNQTQSFHGILPTSQMKVER